MPVNSHGFFYFVTEPCGIVYRRRPPGQGKQDVIGFVVKSENEGVFFELGADSDVVLQGPLINALLQLL